MIAKERLGALRDTVHSLLTQRLEPNLYYHGVHHTFEDVLPAVERLSEGEGLVEGDKQLVWTAALFHDTGFVERYNGNEPIGARLAAQMLPEQGFSSAEIERVLDIILATELKELDGAWVQVPGNDLLKRILCDADLDNLGRADFFKVSDHLRHEIEERGRKFSDLEWYSRQVLFVSQHRWFTETQRKDRQAVKEKNLARLRRLLADLA